MPTLCCPSDAGSRLARAAFTNRLGTVLTPSVLCYDVEAADTVRFGLQVDRGGLPGTASLADSRCQLRVLVYSRNGSASPY